MHHQSTENVCPATRRPCVALIRFTDEAFVARGGGAPVSWYFCFISEAEPRSSFFTDTTLADVGGGFAGGRPIGQQQLMVVDSGGVRRRKLPWCEEKKRAREGLATHSCEFDAENRAESVG